MDPKKILKLGKKLWPLNRSITGEGVNQTLKILKSYIKELRVIKFKSGKKVFDWTIPNEWKVNEAWIKDNDGKKIIDFEKNNLHLVGYSSSIKKKLFFKEFKNCLTPIPPHQHLKSLRINYIFIRNSQTQYPM